MELAAFYFERILVKVILTNDRFKDYIWSYPEGGGS